MRSNIALLLQESRAFFSELEPELSTALANNKLLGVEYLDFKRWLICMELDLVYGLFDATYDRNHPAYNKAYEELKEALNFSLSSCFRHYIKAPKIYPDDNSVVVRLIGEFTLSIGYTSIRNKYIPTT